MAQLEDETAVVTGGGTGIGLAIDARFALPASSVCTSDEARARSLEQCPGN